MSISADFRVRTFRILVFAAMVGLWAAIAWFLLGSPTQDVCRIVAFFEEDPIEPVNELPKKAAEDPIKPANELPKKAAEPVRSLINRENAARIGPGMTLVDVEAMLGKSGWEETAYAKGPAHRWTVKWASIRNEKKLEHEPKDDRPTSYELWVSGDLMVKVFVDQEMRVLRCDIIDLREE